ncbi:uncharacterized protein LOC127565937 [Drosophila albomicans]|uniref:Uncharacterized protein LOC127565937 n=1 Tax=Drosophila albomicans TaxID=7291 RepID=A0A9C6SW05_DROAB|nr:uncharacterized protein LOC127565937 [Drosophila albomicans]
MNLWLFFGLVLLYTKTTICKESIDENPTSLLNNNLLSREDWIKLAKYYVSNHKPYNVKKYVPYKPSNKSITTRKPTLPVISITTELPDITTSPLESSTGSNLDVDDTTKSYQAAETTTEVAIDSTTELITSTTEITNEDSTTDSTTSSTTTEFITSTTELPSSMLLPILGIETTTSTSWNDAAEETTKQDNFSYTTTGIVNIDSTTETNELSSTTIDSVTSIDVTTEAEISTSQGTPESTSENMESTTQKFLKFNETTDSKESTTQLPISTTELPGTTSSSENDATTTEATTPENTTQGLETTTQNEDFSSESPELETTTETKESTTQFPTTTNKISLIEPVTEVNSNETSTTPNIIENTTAANSIIEISTTEKVSSLPQSLNFNDDIIQNKLVNITYSTDGVCDVTCLPKRSNQHKRE